MSTAGRVAALERAAYAAGCGAPGCPPVAVVYESWYGEAEADDAQAQAQAPAKCPRCGRAPREVLHVVFDPDFYVRGNDPHQRREGQQT